MYVAWRQYREEIQVVHFIDANDLTDYLAMLVSLMVRIQPLQMTSYIKIIYELLFDLDVIS